MKDGLFNPFFTVDTSVDPATLDYTTNMYDEWSGNRGIIINDALTEQLAWNGRINETLTNRTGTPAIFSGGVAAPDGVNDGFSIAWSANPDITGAVTFFYLIQKSAKITNINPLFDSNNTTAPRVVLLLEGSNLVDKIRLRYNAVNYDATVSFSYDADYHIVAFRMDGANAIANIWLDGVKVSADFAITGGAVSWTSGTSWMHRSLADTKFGSFNIKKMRIYNEYVSDANMALISAGVFSVPIVDNTPVHVVWPTGQSNVGPDTGVANFRSAYATNLQTGLTRALIWEYFSDRNKYIPIADNVDQFLGGTGTAALYCGPFLKVVRDLMTKYPTHDIRIIEQYTGGTALADQWKANPVGTAYQNWLDRAPTGFRTLIAEQRNIVDITGLWIHGEADGAVQAYSLAYYDNLVEFMADIRSRIDGYLLGLGLPIKVVISALSNRSQTTYRANVRAAQEAFVALDTTNNKFINTDNATDYPYQGVEIHYTTVGLTNIGLHCAEFI